MYGHYVLWMCAHIAQIIDNPALPMFIMGVCMVGWVRHVFWHWTHDQGHVQFLLHSSMSGHNWRALYKLDMMPVQSPCSKDPELSQLYTFLCIHSCINLYRAGILCTRRLCQHLLHRILILQPNKLVPSLFFLGQFHLMGWKEENCLLNW